MSDVILIKEYSDVVKKSFGTSMNQGRFMREVFKASGYDRFPSSSDEDYAKKICNGSKPITDDMIAGFPKPYRIEELADYLREIIDKNANLIHHEYCDSRSLEVRQAKKAIETQTAQLIERINKDTNKIISIIQKRRDELINQLNTNLQAELEKISEKEAIWNQKTKIAQAINKLQIDYNDELVYNNMIFILKGIEMLKEPLKIYEYKSITDYKDNIAFNSTPVTMEDFINVISDMFIIGEDDAIEVPYKA